MFIKRFVVLLTVGFLCVCCASTSYCREETSRKMEFEGFSKLEIGGPFEVDIAQSDRFEVTFTGEEKYLSDIRTSKSGDTLKIDLRGHFNCHNCKLAIKISMPTLTAVELGGAVSASMTGFRGVSRFEVELAGASSLSGDIEANSVFMELSGASNVDLSGSATNLTLDASGASNAELGQFPVAVANVDLSGASDAEISVNEELSVDLSGASDLNYMGNPTLASVDTSGASSLSHK